MAAASMALLLAIGAFSFSISSAYDRRNQLHAAADAAAKSGAISILQLGDALDATELTRFGAKAVADTGITGATLDIHRCDALGATCTAPYNTHTFVEALVSQNVNTFFSALLPFGTLNPAVRAVAGVSSGTACFVVLNDLDMGNVNTVTANTCSIEVGDDSTLGNGTVLTAADTIGVGGDRSGGGSYVPGVSDLPMFSDPLATLTEPTMPSGACIAQPPISANITINPGKYCSWDFQGATTLTLNSGDYYLEGAMTDQNGGTQPSIVGNGGVFIYLGPGAKVDFDETNHLTVNLTAKTSDPYKGIVFYQARGNGNEANFGKNGNAGGVTLNGAMYFPGAKVSTKNHGTSSDCNVVVASGYETMNGANITFEDTCSAFGGSPIKSIAMAE